MRILPLLAAYLREQEYAIREHNYQVWVRIGSTLNAVKIWVNEVGAHKTIVCSSYQLENINRGDYLKVTISNPNSFKQIVEYIERVRRSDESTH